MNMLPIVLYNSMEGGNNNPNFGQFYDENVILNSVRTRKKVSELPNCPVCSCTIRQGELESHLSLEVDRLTKLSSAGNKRKLSVNSSGLAIAGSSTSPDVPDDQEVDVSGCLGSDVYQRVHNSRLRRLRSRRRSPPPAPSHGQCPVCDVTLPVSRLHRHALRCLKRTGASMDEDVSDTSSNSEHTSIDVENDPSEFGEYQWCGEWRVRAAALQERDSRPGVSVRRASNDTALVVDGDEDTELYGPPQYSPSRIAPETEEQPQLQVEEENRTENNGTTEEMNPEKNEDTIHSLKANGLVVASAETRIQALKAKIKELEEKQNGASESKCLICLGQYISPAVSIQCWHVYCEVCWLDSLRAKKICPQCNAITTTQHLRRIYM